MGGLFSGWHGRRSSRPYFDELPRVTIADCKQHPPGLILLPWQGKYIVGRKILAPVGCIPNVPRLQCSRCKRVVTVIYIHDGVACCYRCTDARYRTASESASRRAYRTALAVFRRWKIDPSRPGGKPAWQRWPTFKRLTAEAEAVFPIIEQYEGAPYDLLARIERPRRKRGRPPKSKA